MTDHQAYTYPHDLLRDRIIMITGASDGIGRALALHCAELGAQVILHGRSVKKLEEVGAVFSLIIFKICSGEIPGLDSSSKAVIPAM